MASLTIREIIAIGIILMMGASLYFAHKELEELKEIRPGELLSLMANKEREEQEWNYYQEMYEISKKRVQELTKELHEMELKSIPVLKDIPGVSYTVSTSLGKDGFDSIPTTIINVRNDGPERLPELVKEEGVVFKLTERHYAHGTTRPNFEDAKYCVR